LASSRANVLNLRLCLVLTVTFISLAIGSITVRANTTDELSPDIQWKVGRLSFVGNRALSDAELSKTMRTKSRPAYLLWKKRPEFAPETFKTDIARLGLGLSFNPYRVSISAQRIISAITMVSAD